MNIKKLFLGFVLALYSFTAGAANNYNILDQEEVAATSISTAELLALGYVTCGGVDDTAVINAAIAAGRILTLLGGLCAVTDELSITEADTGFTLQGGGIDATHTTNSVAAAGNTIIKWVGAVDATKAIIKVAPTVGAVRNVNGIKLLGLTLDANSSAGYGLKALSVVEMDLDIYVKEAKTTGVYLGVNEALASTSADSISIQRVRGNVLVKQRSNDGADCIEFDGSQVSGVSGNASLNNLENVDCQIKNGDGIVFKNSDNNIIHYARVLRTTAGLGGKDVRFEGSDGTGSPTIPGVARDNTIYRLSGGNTLNGVTYEGTDTWTNPSYNNNIVWLDKGNATPTPTVGTGVNAAFNYLGSSDLHWHIGPHIEFDWDHTISSDTDINLTAGASSKVIINLLQTTSINVNSGATNIGTGTNPSAITIGNTGNNTAITGAQVNINGIVILNGSNNAETRLGTGTTTSGIKLGGGSNDVTVGDGTNFILGTTTGTKFGKATTQKLAFWNATPIIQPSSTVELKAGVLVALGLIPDGGITPLDLDGGALTAGAGNFSGILISSSGKINATRVITAAGSITVATTDEFICVNKSSGAATVANLSASPATGTHYVITDCKGDAATNNITVTPNAGNIDGSGTFIINTNYGSWEGYYTGTIWKTVAAR